MKEYANNKKLAIIKYDFVTTYTEIKITINYVR